MTDEHRGTGGPEGPPWSVDLLADLHAGVLDPAQSARLWARVNVDPDAKAVIDALSSVQATLGELSAAPAPPMPAHFAARLDAALAAEARRGGLAVQDPPRPGIAPVVDMAEARRKRGKRTAWGVGLLTAAAAAVAVGYGVLPKTEQTGGVAEPAPSATSGDAPLAVSRGNVGAATSEVTNRKEYGPLKDEAGLKRCLTTNGFDAKTSPIGVRPVTFDGKSAVMSVILVPGEGPGLVQVLIVAPDCTQLFNEKIGR
ncbi:hypothetical protein [Actinokineospora globicatena]|uniref:hypothetical protein n=1 Tax=Actinokineospora globicatena TaxID=103729 RepID=UPI0020A386E1|nr:hypothetical protein [Actinokineospora globicatena]MCP2301265.1 hypothetical protein [Actinokineospora globicatena]GLW77097.1 hypothetical protein Aglo01_15790 [Actinokineospora globicatena]GLW83931.1 hypothetical protein Aglo02_15710 [Actinokineospora globicatena]